MCVIRGIQFKRDGEIMCLSLLKVHFVVLEGKKNIQELRKAHFTILMW